MSMVGCASNFMLAKTIASIPNGTCMVTILESDGGTRRYDFVLFETAESGIEMKMPRLKSHGMATPDRYANDATGFIAYEITDGNGNAKGYVLAPATSTVRIWGDSEGNDKLALEIQSPGGGTGGGGGQGGAGGGGNGGSM